MNMSHCMLGWKFGVQELPQGSLEILIPHAVDDGVITGGSTEYITASPSSMLGEELALRMKWERISVPSKRETTMR